MDQSIHIIFFGERGSGKSWLANRIFTYGGESPPFLEGIKKHFTCQPSQTSIDGRKVLVVDTPGVPVDEDIITNRTWRDVIIAQNFCGEYTSLFIIVLDAKKKEEGRKVIQMFLEWFGPDARKVVMVIFTHIDVPYQQNILRALRVDHESVFKALGCSLPILVSYKNDDLNQQQKLIEKIKEVTDGPTYSLKDFKDAQLKYLENWKSGEKLKKKENMSRPEMCEMLEIPDLLINKLFISDAEYFEKAESIIRQHFK